MEGGEVKDGDEGWEGCQEGEHERSEVWGRRGDVAVVGLLKYQKERRRTKVRMERRNEEEGRKRLSSSLSFSSLSLSLWTRCTHAQCGLEHVHELASYSSLLSEPYELDPIG